jgi:hypothetical protein
MLIERGFEREFIVQVILNPDWTEERSETEWHAFKRVGDKVLRVVVNGKTPPYRVVTMFYDRRLKP